MMTATRRALLPLLLVSSAILGDVMAAPALGRVFYTPAERRALEAAQRGERPEAGAPTSEASPGAPGSIRYSGIVQRSQGPTTGFVDGRPIVRNAVGEQAVHLEGDRLVIAGPDGTRRLKPGESLGTGASAPMDGADTRP